MPNHPPKTNICYILLSRLLEYLFSSCFGIFFIFKKNKNKNYFKGFVWSNMWTPLAISSSQHYKSNFHPPTNHRPLPNTHVSFRVSFPTLPAKKSMPSKTSFFFPLNFNFNFDIRFCLIRYYFIFLSKTRIHGN